MAKIAYLISAYIDSKQLKRLIESLEYDNLCDFYIHIDRKVDIIEFEKECENLKNVKFVTDRKWVSWAGYSQVNAILSMIKSMIDSNIKYDRVVSMTGCDYPLWSNKKIQKEFDDNPKKEYMIGFNISKCNSNLQKRKVKRYWLLDINLKKRIFVKAISKFCNFIMTIVPIRKKLWKKDKEGYDIYCSSDYWGLTYECVKELYNKYINDKKLQRYLKTSFAPSELFMATMLFNSKYCENAQIYDSKEYNGLAILTALHYIDYSDGIIVFDENDFKRLKESGKMFGRKFYSGKSDELVKMIDNERKK